jgi:hypothetical protein
MSLSMPSTLLHSVTGEINEVPFFIDEKMVDEACLPRSGRSLGQVFPVREHVDERRLPHVASTIKAYSGLVGAGHFSMSVLLTKNSAFEIFMLCKRMKNKNSFRQLKIK